MNERNEIAIFENDIVRLALADRECEKCDYQLLDEIIYMVINHNEILWQILRDGIKIGGKEYMLFTATTGQVRNVTVTLMRKDFFEKHKGFLMVGLTTESIEYRKLHYNDLKDEIEDLLQVVREFVVKPDYMNELLQALTNAVNTFADRGDIDYEAVNKLAAIIPIMQRLDSKDVAKAIAEEFHNEKVLSQVVSKQPKKSNKGRKPKTEFTVEKGEKTE